MDQDKNPVAREIAGRLQAGEYDQYLLGQLYDLLEFDATPIVLRVDLFQASALYKFAQEMAEVAQDAGFPFSPANFLTGFKVGYDFAIEHGKLNEFPEKSIEGQS